MKKVIAAALVLILLLIVGSAAMIIMSVNLAKEVPAPSTVPTTAPTTAPTTEPTTVPTTEPPPVYTNPLNGEILDEPYTGRVFACTVSNIRDALPHVNATRADIIMEMFVNGSVLRCLALFTDLESVDAIGSVRSTRLMFNDIVQHYDAVLYHAGGSGQVLSNAGKIGIDHINMDTWDVAKMGVSYRDKEYRRGYEHSLFGVGPEMVGYAAAQGLRMTQPGDKDYGLQFVEDGTPENGETAETVSVTITYNQKYHKKTDMKYSEALGKYVWWQYDMEMRDQITDEPEAFENVIIMFADISNDGMYQVADFPAGGSGYFACGGKLVPILWHCDGDTSPFVFTDTNGQRLNLGTGNTYIAITQPDSAVTWGENS